MSSFVNAAHLVTGLTNWWHDVDDARELIDSLTSCLIAKSATVAQPLICAVTKVPICHFGH